MSYLIFKTELQAIYPWQKAQWELLINCYHSATLPHAILLQGAIGMGKRDFAKQLALSLLCQEFQVENKACGRCRHCQLALTEGHPDGFLIQPLENSTVIKIDQIRHLSEKLRESGHCSEKKVVIIQPAESMNLAAANCLLKILEEPPRQVYFILVSHHPFFLPATVRSRCRIISFLPSFEKITIEWLSKHITTSHDINHLLLLTYGSPLTVTEWLKNNILEQNIQFLEDFYQLSLQKMDPISCAEKWLNLEVMQLIDCLIYVIHLVIRFQFSLLLPNTSQQSFINLINFIAKKISPPQLFSYLDKLIKYRGMRIQKLNCNIELLLEDLLISWILLIISTKN